MNVNRVRCTVRSACLASASPANCRDRSQQPTASEELRITHRTLHDTPCMTCTRQHVARFLALTRAISAFQSHLRSISRLFFSNPYILGRFRGRWGRNIGRDFSARAAESRKILEGKPVTIDFMCFLSEIALFFSLSLFLFPLRRLAPSRFGSTRRRSIRYRGPHDHLGGPPRAKSSQGFWD